MENLDARLLRSQEEQNEVAQELNKEKRGAAGGEDGEETNNEPRSLRQRIAAARQAMDLKTKAKEKIEEKVVAPINKATGRALQWAWKSLIPSWGLSSIWINIHVFLKSVFGEKLFCKLGEEWMPKQATDAAGGAGKVLTKSAGLVEVMVLIFIDLIIFFVIVGLVAMFTDEDTFKAMTGESNKTQATPAVQQVK